MTHTLSLGTPDGATGATISRHSLHIAVDASTVHAQWCRRIRELSGYFGRVATFRVYGNVERQPRLTVDWRSRDDHARVIDVPEVNGRAMPELTLSVEATATLLRADDSARPALVLVSENRALQSLTAPLIKLGYPVIWLSESKRSRLPKWASTWYQPLGQKVPRIVQSSVQKGSSEQEAAASIEAQRSGPVIQKVQAHIRSVVATHAAEGKTVETASIEGQIAGDIRALMGRIPLTTWARAHPDLRLHADTDDRFRVGLKGHVRRVKGPKAKPQPTVSAEQFAVDLMRMLGEG